jgi:hypothetical protein
MAATSSDESLNKRLGSLETGHQMLSQGLNRLEKLTEGLATSFADYMKEQNSAPRAIPFKEIMITAASTWALGTSVLLFLDNRFTLSTQPTVERVRDQKEKIESLEKKIEKLAEQVAPITFSMRALRGGN